MGATGASDNEKSEHIKMCSSAVLLPTPVASVSLHNNTQLGRGGWHKFSLCKHLHCHTLQHWLCFFFFFWSDSRPRRPKQLYDQAVGANKQRDAGVGDTSQQMFWRCNYRFTWVQELRFISGTFSQQFLQVCLADNRAKHTTEYAHYAACSASSCHFLLTVIAYPTRAE